MANVFLKFIQKLFLPLVLEFNIVNIHGISVLDAHFFQTLEKAHSAQLHVEVVPGFIVIEIDVLNQPLQPDTGDQPGIAIMLHFKGRAWRRK